MFISLTENDGEPIYVNPALVISFTSYDGQKRGGPYGGCRSRLLCGGSGYSEEQTVQLYVRETPKEIMQKVILAGLQGNQ
jgi:hypothetical protein